MALLRKLTEGQKRTISHWAMELVIVVAGVMIALWLQEWVQRRQALQTMRSAQDAVHDEVRSALESLVWREAIRKCHFDRANILKDGLTGASDRWPGLNENALIAKKPGGRFDSPTVVPSVYIRPVDNFTHRLVVGARYRRIGANGPKAVRNTRSDLRPYAAAQPNPRHRGSSCDKTLRFSFPRATHSRNQGRSPVRAL